MKPAPPHLYRYSERKHLDAIMANGRFRFAHARTFLDSTLMAAQQDDERKRYFTPDAATHQIHVSQPMGSAQPLSNVFNIRVTLNLTGRTGKPLDYYILCFALAEDNRFYSEFPVDACLRFNNPDLLARRLEAACRALHPDCDFYGRDCIYYDPMKLPPTVDQKDLVFSKDMRYAWQREFRIIFAVAPCDSAPDHLFFDLGPQSDIADYV